MRISINTSGCRSRLLALAVGAIPLSLSSSASAGTYWNDAGTFTWINSNDWIDSLPDGTPWLQATNRNMVADRVDNASIVPSFGQPTSATIDAAPSPANPAVVRSASPEMITRAIAAPALSLYSWDAALPVPAAGTVLIKVDNTIGDADFGDVILQGNSATLYNLIITSASASMNSPRYDSLANQYSQGNGSEAATMQGLAVDNTTNHSGFFSVFTQTTTKIQEVGFGLTLDFTAIAQSVDMSTFKKGQNLFSGGISDLAFEWSSPNGQLVNGLVEYSHPNHYWENSAGSGNLGSGNNWSLVSPTGTDAGGIPGTNDTAFIANTDALSHVVTLDESDTLLVLQIGSTGGGTDTLSQAGAFNLSLLTEGVGAGAGVGVHNQSAGSNSISGSLNIGSAANSVGTYNLSGSGSLNVGGIVNVGGLNGVTTGIGTLAVSGGSLSVTNSLTVYPKSTLSHTGGTITASTLTIDYLGTFSQSAGTLSVGDLIVDSGATLKLTGGTLSAQETNISQLNAQGFATVITTGSLTLAGVLAVYEDAQSEAATSSSQNFVIVQATNGGALSGAFSNIASGQVLATTDDTASFLVTINGGVNGDVVLSDFQPIPEPGAAGLLGIGAASILVRRRRRR